ncbi:emp24/gp25L/p24 family protein [archaeon]|nr:MAG: emp24/gp25L/p24 family protein [archaeon]
MQCFFEPIDMGVHLTGSFEVLAGGLHDIDVTVRGLGDNAHPTPACVLAGVHGVGRLVRRGRTDAIVAHVCVCVCVCVRVCMGTRRGCADFRPPG